MAKVTGIGGVFFKSKGRSRRAGRVVSESLAAAAVRAAVAGPSPAVSQLATEFTKMFLLNKILVGTATLAGAVSLALKAVGRPGQRAFMATRPAPTATSG